MISTTRLVCATRRDREAFWRDSWLGKSLLGMPEVLRPTLVIAFENAEGLPDVYNRAIEACPEGQNLLFVHDDLYLHDPFVQMRIEEGLRKADLIGLAGSRGTDPRHPSWALGFDEFLRPVEWQRGTGVLPSGAVSHCPETPGLSVPPVTLSLYGTFPAECDLLDGVFLACRRASLGTGLRFDPRFAFHLYDLDFCREAKRHGLTLYTWPILCTHSSAGNFSCAEFKTAARAYLQKWEETEKRQTADSRQLTAPEGAEADSRQQTASGSGIENCSSSEGRTSTGSRPKPQAPSPAQPLRHSSLSSTPTSAAERAP